MHLGLIVIVLPFGLVHNVCYILIGCPVALHNSLLCSHNFLSYSIYMYGSSLSSIVISADVYGKQN